MFLHALDNFFVISQALLCKLLCLFIIDSIFHANFG